jgi:hypothetical protein
MRRIIVLTFLTALAWPLSGARAQIGIGIGTGGIGFGIGLGGGHDRFERKLEQEVQYLKRELNLDKAQESAVRRLVFERENKRDRAGRGERAARFQEGMKEVLTPEQYDKFQTLQQGETPRERRKKEKLPESEWDDVYR